MHSVNVGCIQKQLVTCNEHWCKPAMLIIVVCHVVLGFCKCCMCFAEGALHAICELCDSLNPMWGCCPVLTKNGVCCVDEWIWLLYVNLAIGSQSSQSSCLLFTKIYKYCFSSWFTCFVCPSIKDGRLLMLWFWCQECDRVHAWTATQIVNCDPTG